MLAEARLVRILDVFVQVVWWTVHLSITTFISELPGDLQDALQQLQPRNKPTAAFHSVVEAADIATTSHVLGVDTLPPKAILFACVFVANVLAYYWARCSDPGVIRGHVAGGLDTDVEMQYGHCNSCGAGQQLPTTKHCKVCNRCVLGWDHHCGWLGNCVGQNNHRHFLLYLFLETVIVGLSFDLVICSPLSYTPAQREAYLFLGLLIIIGPSLLFIGSLLTLHTLLALSGMTSREVMRRLRRARAAGPPGRSGHRFGSGSETTTNQSDGKTHRRGPCTFMLSNLVAFCLGGRAPVSRGGTAQTAACCSRAWKVFWCGFPGTVVLQCVDNACDNSWYSCF